MHIICNLKTYDVPGDIIAAVDRLMTLFEAVDYVYGHCGSSDRRTDGVDPDAITSSNSKSQYRHLSVGTANECALIEYLPKGAQQTHHTMLGHLIHEQAWTVPEACSTRDECQALVLTLFPSMP